MLRIMGKRRMKIDELVDKCTKIHTRQEILGERDTATNHVYQGFSHGDFGRAIFQACEDRGLKVTDSLFALNQDSYDAPLMVGALEISGPGIPNSKNGKSQMLLRHQPFVHAPQVKNALEVFGCTNGCTNGMLLAKHKHTKGLDLYSWAKDEVIGNWLEDCQRQIDYIDHLKGIEVSDDAARHIFFEAITTGLMPSARAQDAYDEWMHPVFPEDLFPHNTAWKAYSDMTHVAQKCSNADRHMRIVEDGGRLVEDVLRMRGEIVVLNEAGIAEGMLV